MAARGPPDDHSGMSPWTNLEADRAFTQAARRRRRAAFMSRLRHRCVECSRLPVVLATAARKHWHGVCELPLDMITGTTEPNRAEQFDSQFRPSPITRPRWERVYAAQERGATLPPISVVAAGDGFAIRDGHHRVSVARARGAATINAVLAG
jgi:hypothetical protein